MDIIRVKDCIEKIITEIGKFRREIEDKGKARASSIKSYKMKTAIALATLNECDNYKLGDKTYKKPPVSIMEKIAEGICAQERYEMEIAESGYKACIVNLEALLAQLNAYQSIYRHLE